MIRAFFPWSTNPAASPATVRVAGDFVQTFALVLIVSALLAQEVLGAQAVTIDTRKGGPIAVQQGQESQVDRQYQQIAPTHVELPTGIMDTKTRLELMRVIQAEQGFAMRPFPRGHKGLTLVANGKLEPAGEGYLNMAINSGV